MSSLTSQRSNPSVILRCSTKKELSIGNGRLCRLWFGLFRPHFILYINDRIHFVRGLYVGYDVRLWPSPIESLIYCIGAGKFEGRKSATLREGAFLFIPLMDWLDGLVGDLKIHPYLVSTMPSFVFFKSRFVNKSPNNSSRRHERSYPTCTHVFSFSEKWSRGII